MTREYQEHVAVLQNYVMYTEKVLGEGRNSIVLLGRDTTSNELVAIKMVDGKTLGTSAVASEIQFMQKFQNHKNVIKLKSVVEDEEGFVYMVMEYLNSDLLTFVNEHTGGLEEELAKYIFRQIISVVKYMHCNKVFHGDIKLDNVLLDRNNPSTLRLIDFGFSKKLKHRSQKCDSLTGTKGYSAPEISDSQMKKAPCDPFKCDIYSLGVLLHCLLFGRLPLLERVGSEIADKTTQGKTDVFVFPKNHKLHSESVQPVEYLLSRMLSTNPDLRPSIFVIENYPWLGSPKSFLASIRKHLNM